MTNQGFIYLWWDTKRNLYYLGSHKGTQDDGYTGSNKRFQTAYKSRPHTFRRKIIETLEFDDHKLLLDREEYWLSLIKDEELHCNKYYNEKKFAGGGNIIETLPEEKKKQHREKSRNAVKRYWSNITEKDKFCHYSKSNTKRRNKWTKESGMKNGDAHAKRAILSKDNVTLEITNIRRFCEQNNLNYGNMKTLLRGNAKFSTVGGWRGQYV